MVGYGIMLHVNDLCCIVWLDYTNLQGAELYYVRRDAL